jgi:alpha/beta superfamily hydrolase
MVQPGQFLERSVVIKSGDLSLDGLYHRGRRAPPCAIASPHPALGGSMAVPTVAELAWALTQAGFPTLRFDYRGVGASQGRSRHPAGEGRIGEISDEVADLGAALEQLLQSTGAQVACVVGYSFGAAVALQAAQDPRVERVVLVAPPTALWDFSGVGELQKPLLVVCAHHDPLCQRSRLELPEGGQLAVIAHADHAFLRGLQELGRTVAAWVGSGPERELPEGSAADERAPESFREVDLPESTGPGLELDED